MKHINEKEKLVELRAQGHSLQAIAKMLGIAKQTVVNWVKELEIEIHNSRALELDSLYEQNFMHKQARIELLGEQLSKVKAELAKRQFDNVSTEKLFDMQLRLIDIMKQEKETLTIKESQGFTSFLSSKKEYDIKS